MHNEAFIKLQTLAIHTVVGGGAPLKLFNYSSQPFVIPCKTLSFFIKAGDSQVDGCVETKLFLKTGLMAVFTLGRLLGSSLHHEYMIKSMHMNSYIEELGLRFCATLFYLRRQNLIKL